MSADSKIEWTDATWNPITGCTKVSPGCDHCYAERITERFHGKGSFAQVKLHPERLDLPLRWRKPRQVFVNSMSDLFHDKVSDDFIANMFAVMSMSPIHTFQILTKRQGRMRSLLNAQNFWRKVGDHGRGIALERVGGQYPAAGPMALTSDSSAGDHWEAVNPLVNAWLGVSVEDQYWAKLRIPVLEGTPAAVRFLSCEPLLSAVDLSGWLPRGIDWVIVGGESGTGARPIREEWVRSLVQQCQAAQVPVFVKQLGSRWDADHGRRGKGGDINQWPAELQVREWPGACGDQAN